MSLVDVEMSIDNRQFFPPGVSQEIEYVEDKNGRVHIIGVGLILYDNTSGINVDMENNINGKNSRHERI